MGVLSGAGAGCDGASGRHGVGVSEFVFKMPDLGEGTVDAEIVAWHTKPGDVVTEDQLIVEVMTDKAAVEVPAPVSGRVLSVSGAPGEKVAVGSPLIVFELSDDSAAHVPAAAAPAPAAPTQAAPRAAAVPAVAPGNRAARVMTSPANRRRAHEAGVDLATVAGSGPGGRIVRSDLDAAITPSASPKSVAGATAGPQTTEIKVIGLRRLIAERMSEAKRN